MESNSAKAVPMRGPVKDAEAEALLRLLRREKEFESQACMPTNIQRKVPLPAIGSTCQHGGEAAQLAVRRQSDPTTKQARHSDAQNEKELQNESKYQWRNRKNSIPPAGHPAAQSSNVSLVSPGYSWRTAEASQLAGSKQKKPSHSLPPIGYEDLTDRPGTPAGRPSCPVPSSQFWDDSWTSVLWWLLSVLLLCYIGTPRSG